MRSDESFRWRDPIRPADSFVSGGPRVLVVEDEFLVAMFLEDILEELGCVVEGPAASVDAALALIEQNPPDAAILDVNLNGSPAYAVADALRARGIPFAFSSGYELGPEVAERYNAPCLRKPISREELESAFLPLIAQRQA